MATVVEPKREQGSAEAWRFLRRCFCARIMDSAAAWSGRIFFARYGLAPVLHSSRHLPTLDGLRGIAILAVLAMHFGIMTPLNAFDRFVYAVGRNGWIGVDLFFVLSGFLITGILLDSRGRAGALRAFYARRFLRIFPLYYGLLVAIFVVAPLLVGGALWLEKLRPDQLWHWLYLTNVLAASGTWPDVPHIGHLWSLAIEEQFYLVWPFAVLFLPQRRLVPLCLGMLGISLVARVAMVFAKLSPIAVYTLTFTRWDGLAVGALIAILARRPGGMERLERWSLPVLAVGAAACVGIFAAEPYRSHYGVATQTTGYLVLALTFGALLVQAVRAPAGSRLERALRDSRLRFFGRYSYGIYVLHGPLLGALAALGVTPKLLPAVWGSAIPGQLVFASIALSLTTAAALASWTVWEKPFLSLKRHFPSPGSAPRVEAGEAAELRVRPAA